MIGHSYNRKCWCTACRAEGMHRLLTVAQWFFGVLFVLMLATPLIAYLVVNAR